MTLIQGTKLGVFDIIAPVGKGGQGEVYRARDGKLGRDVAIKVLPEHLLENPDSLRRFQREAKMLAALSHPNILTIHDAGTENGISYVVTELLEGETLRSRISRSPMPCEKALQIAVPVAEGVAAAHSKGVIHRDLKPENVFLTTDGRVKILDFGLARFKRPDPQGEFTNAPTESRPTESEVVMGTIPYMSPEQVRGESVDVRTDIFSFGCMLHEMLAGKRAFQGNTSAEVMASILRDEPAHAADIPPELDHIIHRCLEKNPQQRFQSAGDLAFALKEIVGASGRSISSSPPSQVQRRGIRRIGIAVGILFLVTGLIWTLLNRERFAGKPQIGKIESLAVLPLKNLSGDPGQEYFADGMTEELIAKLARIESLRVISRTSVMEYKAGKKSLPQIARELNVDVIVEGSVFRAGDQVRITAQLIHASTDRHLWAESYERDMRDILKLQNEVASAIAREIKIKLTPGEQQRLASARQVNPAAYEAYLRGIDYGSRPGWLPKDLREAEQMFQQAVDLDPNFAVAYALLSHEHSFLYHLGADPSQDRVLRAKAAIDRAFELEPDLPEAHRELGYYYYFCFKDFDKALAEFSIAEKGIPKDDFLFHAFGTVHRRQGKFEAAISDYTNARQLSPRAPQHPYELGNTLRFLRRYGEAQTCYEQAITLDPKNTAGYLAKAETDLLWKGSTGLARDELRKIPASKDDGVINLLFYLEVYEGKYQAALDRLLSPSNESVWGRAELAINVAQVYRLMGKSEKAKPLLEDARTTLEKKLDATHQHNGMHDAENHSSLGLILANLGRKTEAIGEGKQAVEVYSPSRDAIFGSYQVFNLARIYLIVGESDEAIKLQDHLLSIPFGRSVSVPLLRVDPEWDPIRNHPEFQKLLQKYSQD